MIDPAQFGLPAGTVIKFFTPEEAQANPGVKSGYNAVYTFPNNRVRYELLKAAKTMESVQQQPNPPVVDTVLKKQKDEPPAVIEPTVPEVVISEVLPVTEEQVAIEETPVVGVSVNVVDDTAPVVTVPKQSRGKRK